MPPFTGSDVPLEQDILKKKIEFIQSWTEFAAQNFDQVIRSAQRGTAGNQVLFAVPENNTLFITSAWCSMIAHTIGGGTSTGGILIPNGVFLVGVVLTGTSAGLNSNSNSLNLTMPVKIESGGLVQINNPDTFKRTAAGFTGFLVPKRIT